MQNNVITTKKLQIMLIYNRILLKLENGGVYDMHRVILVTGASRGIGRSIALKFAKEGYDVVINSHRNEAALKQVEEEIKQLGVDCLSFLGDVGNYDFVTSMFTLIKQRFHSLDVLINNAGVSSIGLFTDMSPEEYTRLINTNLISVMNCCHQAVPMFLKKKSGNIINISSVWGITGASCEAVYSASKGGINAFTKALGKELAPSNIKVNAVACGAIDTDMNRCFSKEDLQALKEEIPAGRMGKPEEVANFIYSLINHPYLNAQILTLDGGWI